MLIRRRLCVSVCVCVCVFVFNLTGLRFCGSNSLCSTDFAFLKSKAKKKKKLIEQIRKKNHQEMPACKIKTNEDILYCVIVDGIASRF